MIRTWLIRHFELAAVVVVVGLTVAALGLARMVLAPSWSKEFRANYVEKTTANFTMIGMPRENAQKVAVCLADAVEPKVSQKRMEILRNTDEEPTAEEMKLGDAAIRSCVCVELRALGVPCE